MATASPRKTKATVCTTSGVPPRARPAPVPGPSGPSPLPLLCPSPRSQDRPRPRRVSRTMGRSPRPVGIVRQRGRRGAPATLGQWSSKRVRGQGVDAVPPGPPPRRVPPSGGRPLPPLLPKAAGSDPRVGRPTAPGCPAARLRSLHCGLCTVIGAAVRTLRQLQAPVTPVRSGSAFPCVARRSTCLRLCGQAPLYTSDTFPKRPKTLRGPCRQKGPVTGECGQAPLYTMGAFPKRPKTLRGPRLPQLPQTKFLPTEMGARAPPTGSLPRHPK